MEQYLLKMYKLPLKLAARSLGTLPVLDRVDFYFVLFFIMDF